MASVHQVKTEDDDTLCAELSTVRRSRVRQYYRPGFRRQAHANEISRWGKGLFEETTTSLFELSQMEEIGLPTAA